MTDDEFYELLVTQTMVGFATVAQRSQAMAQARSDAERMLGLRETYWELWTLELTDYDREALITRVRDLSGPPDPPESRP